MMPADRRRQILGAHDLGALLVDHLALVVGDVVEQQQLLADVEVVRLDLALRLLDLAGEHAALDDLAFLHAGHLQQPLGAHRVAEDAHQVVFHRQVEAARARVALAARAAAQLVVDAARLVALGADDVQAAGGQHLRRAAPARPRAAARASASSASAGSAASSASRLPPSTMSVPRPAMLVAMVTVPGRPAWATMCASRSCCLAFSTWCGNVLLLQQAGEELGGLDRGGADQRRLAALARSPGCPR